MTTPTNPPAKHPPRSPEEIASSIVQNNPVVHGLIVMGIQCALSEHTALLQEERARADKMAQAIQISGNDEFNAYDTISRMVEHLNHGEFKQAWQIGSAAIFEHAKAHVDRAQAARSPGDAEKGE